MQHGHTVRLMAPEFVAPYRMSGRERTNPPGFGHSLSGKRGKNDAADAQAICEAVQRPNMRFVPVKSQDELLRACRRWLPTSFPDEPPKAPRTRRNAPRGARQCGRPPCTGGAIARN
jgi:transposase